jgi:hypothetical protein
LLDRFHDLLEHSVRIPKNVVVPEAQDAKAAFPQVDVACSVSRTISVLASIRFNDEHLLERHEVNNPRPEGYLPAEFCFDELARTKELPELLFCVGRRMPKMARLASLKFGDSVLWHFPPHPPRSLRSLGTLSHKGRG